MLLAYLISSFPTAIFIGKVFFKQDPREFGSKNAGGTNAGRLWGKKVGLIVIAIDMIKTVLPLIIVASIMRYSGIDNANFNLYNHGILYYYLAAVGGALGHCYPLFASFRGGKAVSNFFALALFTSWLLLLISILFFLVLKIKKYVSLASITVSFVIVAIAWIMGGLHAAGIFDMNFFIYGGGAFFNFGTGYELPLALTLIHILLVYRHRANIKRIIANTERKITWMK